MALTKARLLKHDFPVHGGRPESNEKAARKKPESNISAWPPLQSLAVKKNFFCANLGGEKLLKFVEKCR